MSRFLFYIIFDQLFIIKRDTGYLSDRDQTVNVHQIEIKMFEIVLSVLCIFFVFIENFKIIIKKLPYTIMS